MTSLYYRALYARFWRRRADAWSVVAAAAETAVLQKHYRELSRACAEKAMTWANPDDAILVE